MQPVHGLLHHSLLTSPPRTRGSSPASCSAARQRRRVVAFPPDSGRPVLPASRPHRYRLGVACVRRYRLRRLQRPAADEDAEAAEQDLLGWSEQDRGLQAIVSRSVCWRAGQIARATSQGGKPALEAGRAARRARGVSPGRRPARSPAATHRAGRRSRPPPGIFRGQGEVRAAAPGPAR